MACAVVGRRTPTVARSVPLRALNGARLARTRSPRPGPPLSRCRRGPVAGRPAAPPAARSSHASSSTRPVAELHRLRQGPDPVDQIAGRVLARAAERDPRPPSARLRVVAGRPAPRRRCRPSARPRRTGSLADRRRLDGQRAPVAAGTQARARPARPGRRPAAHRPGPAAPRRRRPQPRRPARLAPPARRAARGSAAARPTSGPATRPSSSSFAVSASRRTAWSPNTASSTRWASTAVPPATPTSAPTRPPVWAKTTIIKRHADTVHPQGEEPRPGPLAHALVGHQVQHRALPVPDRPGRVAREVRRGAGEVLGRVVEQPTTGRRWPARTPPPARPRRPPPAQQRLQPRLDRHLEVARTGGSPRKVATTPVAQPADLLLHRPEELTGADELVPPGQHLAPQQGAVRGLYLDGPDRFGVGVVDLAAQLVDHLELLVHRTRQPRGRERPASRWPRRGSGSTTSARLARSWASAGQPAADGLDRRPGQQPLGVHGGLRDGEQRRVGQPAFAHHLPQMRRHVRHRPRRHPVQHHRHRGAALGRGPQELPGHGVGVTGRRGDEQPEVGGGQQLGGQLPVLRDHRVDVGGVQDGQARAGSSRRSPAAGSGCPAPPRSTGPGRAGSGRRRTSGRRCCGAPAPGARVVGRITPGALTRRPTSELTSVDLPAPVDPPTTASNGASMVASRGST